MPCLLKNCLDTWPIWPLLTCTWKTVMESSNIRTLTDIILPNLEDTGVFSLESPPLIEWWSIWEEGVWWPAREPARPPCTPAIVGSPWVILYSSIIRFHFGFSTTWNNVIEISALSLFLCRSGKLKDNGKRERKKVSFQILALPFKRGIACAVRLERTASKLQCTKIQLLASGIVTAKKGIDITFCIQLWFFGGQKKTLAHDASNLGLALVSTETCKNDMSTQPPNQNAKIGFQNFKDKRSAVIRQKSYVIFHLTIIQQQLINLIKNPKQLLRKHIEEL